MQSLLIAFQHSGYVQHGIFTFPSLALVIGILFSYWLQLQREAAKVAYGVSVGRFAYGADDKPGFASWNAVREAYAERLDDLVVRKLEVFSYSKSNEFPPVVLR